MRARLVLLATVGLLLLALTGCDNFVEYTVVNETDQELITWPFDHDCSAPLGKKDDYGDEEMVRPWETVSYSDITWDPDPECVQVALRDRRLVLSEPYEYGGTYVIAEPLETRGDRIPERDDLPSASFRESWIDLFKETPPLVLVFSGLGMILTLEIFAVLAYLLFIAARAVYRRYGSSA